MAMYFHRSYSLPVTCGRFALTAEAPEILRPTGWSGRFMFLSGMLETMRSTGRKEAAEILQGIHQPDREMLLIPYDEDGRPYEFHMCDVRDLIQGLLLLLEDRAAVGEVFNLSGPSSFVFDKAVSYLSAKSGIPYVEARLPGPPIRIRHSISKARSFLGYDPRYDIYKIIDSAIAARVG
jgi:UDP-glucose 4-epimerase